MKTFKMWWSWAQFIVGLLIGYAYRALPVIIMFAVAAALTLMFWNGLVVRTWLLPRARFVDAAMFVIGIRMLGILWRGDKNPLAKPMRVKNFYE